MPKPENLIGKGFDKRPQNINKKGRPKKLISYVNTSLSKEGYKPATDTEIKEAFLIMINLPFSKIKEIADVKNDDGFPMLYKLVAKELMGRRGQEMLEKSLDRGIGRAQQHVDHTTGGDKISIIFESANGRKD